MLKQITVVFAVLAMSAVAFGQTNIRQDNYYQLGYAANLNIGDSVVNLTNDGAKGGFYGAVPPTVGNICANVYVFDPSEEEVSCCSCLVTPNGLNSLSAKNDLINNVLTPAIPTSIVIKVTGSVPGTTSTGAFTVCNPATAGAVGGPLLSLGLMAWGVTVEPSSSGTYNAVNVPFLQAFFPEQFGPATAGGELAALTSVCGFIRSNGTGYGICNSCALGALSGTKQ